MANSGVRPWYRIQAKASGTDEVDIYIYDEIGYYGVSASAFVKDLQAVKARQLNVHLNTPGGDVFDGIAIHNALREHTAQVHVQVDSLAASIGSVIAMAGDTVTMAQHSTMMIHDPFGLVMGNAADMTKMAEVLNQLADTIAGIYMRHAGGSAKGWRQRMLDETWYSDREAVDAGLADKVAGDPSPQNRFDLSMYKHAPEHLCTPKTEDEQRLIALRDAMRSALLGKA